MSKFAKANKAAEDLAALGKKFQGILDLKDTLQEIGSLEQAHEEALVRIAQSEKFESVASQKLAEIKAEIQSEIAKLSEAKVKAPEVLKEAAAAAALKISQGQLEGEEIVKGAKNVAAQIEAEFLGKKKEIEALKQEAADAKALVESFKAEFSALKAKLGV